MRKVPVLLHDGARQNPSASDRNRNRVERQKNTGPENTPEESTISQPKLLHGWARFLGVSSAGVHLDT